MGKINEAEMTKKAKYFESRTESEEIADHEWAVKNGASFSGPGSLKKAIAAAKVIKKDKARKVMMAARIDPDTILKIKAKANRVGIPYQTLINSVLKRYADGKLEIEVA
jgi:predicted DNA binding CopG/RHH family protein